MKIIVLQAENIKKLKAVEIRPDGNLVQITGRNGQGKTSILDAIMWALRGASSIQAQPVRQGEHQARIRLEMGDIIVTRHFKPGKDGEITSSVTVENAEGAKFPSPQVMLDKLLGKLSFDPLEFSRMNPGAQLEVAKSFVPGFDFVAVEVADKQDREDRTALARRIKDVRAVADKITYALGTPDEKVDASALVDQMARAAQTNADIQTRKGNRAAAQVKVNTDREKAAELRAQAKMLTEEADALAAAAEELDCKIQNAEPLPEPVDVSKLKEQIDQANITNENVELKKRKAGYEDDIKKMELTVAKLDAAIEDRQKRKRDTIAAAKLPVQGLEFGDGQILMNGVPFEQSSDAEKLKVSIAIAMALNPKVRVIRVRDGSLLDEASMKLLEEMADQKDYQVWVERVDSSGKVGFVIENGQVVEHVGA